MLFVLLCGLVTFEAEPSKIELQRELYYSGIERAPELAKALAVYILSFATDEEIGVVESVKQLGAEFYVHPLVYSGSFDESNVEIPITWSIDWSQLKRAKSTR